MWRCLAPLRGDQRGTETLESPQCLAQCFSSYHTVQDHSCSAGRMRLNPGQAQHTCMLNGAILTEF